MTNEYFAKYETISWILDENPRLLDLVHCDLKEPLGILNSGASEDDFEYTSETVLRMAICQNVEGLSLRGTVIRIDDSHFLRRFVHIDSGPMMDFTTFCRLRNAISPQTWKKVNQALARYAVEKTLIEGDELRIDTTAVETNIHWPTDSSLLWDTYRVLARVIAVSRELDPRIVGNRRIHTKRVKRRAAEIARKASKKPGSQEKLRPLYQQLIEQVLDICQWAEEVRQNLEEKCRKGRGGDLVQETAAYLAEEIAHYRHLGLRVIDQASRRVLDGEQVPNEEKLFSIFEPHTELLKRGKAGKDIEYGHMIQIQQVASKFITDYEVFEMKPVEHQLLEGVLKSHRKLFGESPRSISADKGYYESMDAIAELRQEIDVVSIAKKGKRTEEETLRESDEDFRAAQRFRAGVEGTISFLKRILGLFRCFNKGWDHYVSTVGATIFTHNLLILARA
ncbi:MAG: ISNCY family transposase [Rhodothermales bacterium]|nr:ISNCY family transposase [Rhodothermales bacterium]